MCVVKLPHRTSAWVSRKSWFQARENHYPLAGRTRRPRRRFTEAEPESVGSAWHPCDRLARCCVSRTRTEGRPCKDRVGSRFWATRCHLEGTFTENDSRPPSADFTTKYLAGCLQLDSVRLSHSRANLAAGSVLLPLRRCSPHPTRNAWPATVPTSLKMASHLHTERRTAGVNPPVFRMLVRLSDGEWYHLGSDQRWERHRCVFGRHRWAYAAPLAGILTLYRLIEQPC
jgi:hypothetical protein